MPCPKSPGGGIWAQWLPADSWGAAAKKMPLPALPDGGKLSWKGAYRGGLDFSLQADLCKSPDGKKPTPQTSWISCPKERLLVLPVRIFQGNVGHREERLCSPRPGDQLHLLVSKGCEIRLFWVRKFPPVPKVGRGLGKGAARRNWRWGIPCEWMSMRKQSWCLSWMFLYSFIFMDILE